MCRSSDASQRPSESASAAMHRYFCSSARIRSGLPMSANRPSEVTLGYYDAHAESSIG
jgi:hypothetical protein